MRSQAGPARPAMAAARALRPDLSASAARSGGIAPSTRETLRPRFGWSSRPRYPPQDLAAIRGWSQSMALTLTPGRLIVASAYPDPPFDLIANGSPRPLAIPP